MYDSNCRLLCLSNELLVLLKQMFRFFYALVKLLILNVKCYYEHKTPLHTVIFKAFYTEKYSNTIPWVKKTSNLRKSSNYALLYVQNYGHCLKGCKTLVLYSCNHFCMFRCIIGVIMLKFYLQPSLILLGEAVRRSGREVEKQEQKNLPAITGRNCWHDNTTTEVCYRPLQLIKCIHKWYS